VVPRTALAKVTSFVHGIPWLNFTGPQVTPLEEQRRLIAHIVEQLGQEKRHTGVSALYSL
jgi:hypothetical protein